MGFCLSTLEMLPPVAEPNHVSFGISKVEISDGPGSPELERVWRPRLQGSISPVPCSIYLQLSSRLQSPRIACAFRAHELQTLAHQEMAVGSGLECS